MKKILLVLTCLCVVGSAVAKESSNIKGNNVASSQLNISFLAKPSTNIIESLNGQFPKPRTPAWCRAVLNGCLASGAFPEDCWTDYMFCWFSGNNP